jgi:hypothetical protein
MPGLVDAHSHGREHNGVVRSEVARRLVIWHRTRAPPGRDPPRRLYGAEPEVDLAGPQIPL